MKTLTQHTNAVAEQVLAQDADRFLVAVTGAPGCGKSTLAHEVARRLNAQGRKTSVVPMDGFHLDNGILFQTFTEQTEMTLNCFGISDLMRSVSSRKPPTSSNSTGLSALRCHEYETANAIVNQHHEMKKYSFSSRKITECQTFDKIAHINCQL